jgi:asparagine synthase (glutamine-hydrolysing)
MCGIVGFVNNNHRTADTGILAAMNAAIVHRGPDDEGAVIDGYVALAMRRLAIIDIVGGHQPLISKRTGSSIVFNGEIYNYRELRSELEALGEKFETDSDTEVLLRLYDLKGADCLSKLRGMFAFAVWNPRDKTLFCARDRVGKKPFLYSHRPNGDFIFGSEFRALLAHPEISRDVDPAAIDEYLSFLCVPAPRTAFAEIRKLEPAHSLLWKDGEVTIERYWSPNFNRKIVISSEEAIEETTRLLREATRLRMISDVPLGAFLSGGVDSSTVVALMAGESESAVKTFSIGFDDSDYSELKYARMVASHVGAEYNEMIVRPDAMEVLPTLVEHYGEPYADSSAIPTFYVSRETRRHVTVALNGDGGDESFAGYERYSAMVAASLYRKVPATLRKALLEWPVSILPTSDVKRSRVRDIQRFLSAAGLDRGDRYLRWTSAFTSEEKSALYSDRFKNSIGGMTPVSVLNKWLDFEQGATGHLDSVLLTDLMTYLPNDLLVKVDIASMANSLEARSPFLDHKVIEFAASLPEGIKMNGLSTKSLLKKVAANLVPSEAVYRRKMGFGVPVGRWLKNEMREFTKEVLLSDRSLNRGMFDADVVRRYVSEHLDNRKDHSFRLWTLLMLELWTSRFID